MGCWSEPSGEPLTTADSNIRGALVSCGIEGGRTDGVKSIGGEWAGGDAGDAEGFNGRAFASRTKGSGSEAGSLDPGEFHQGVGSKAERGLPFEAILQFDCPKLRLG